MSNTFLNGLKAETNYTLTQNGGLAHASTLNAVYDMFSLGGAYRQRSDEDCIVLFKKAFDEDPTYALKCLFYQRDCRGGAGERRFFRVIYKWLIGYNYDAAKRNLKYLPEYGRWDDLIYTTYQTKLWDDAVSIVKAQLTTDIASMLHSGTTGISLLAKWMPSVNTSSAKTREVANALCAAIPMSVSNYRKTLSKLRERIKVLERLMSANRWDEIEFDKVPSKAGLVYKNAFARRDMIAAKYEAFVKDDTKKVNAGTLFPYEVVDKAVNYLRGYNHSDTDRAAINKYWANIPDIFKDADFDGLVVCDTSGSMTWGSGPAVPINVAISLALYCAERAKGPFANHYISFASRPRLIETVGADFIDKVNRIYRANLCDNTNLEAVFNLLLETAVKNKCSQDDLPKTIIVCSDMQIDQAQGHYSDRSKPATMMENMRRKWAGHGYVLPRLIYWNINASRDTFLDDGPDVTYVSGASKDIFRTVLTGKTGLDAMYETLDSERYAVIQ